MTFDSKRRQNWGLCIRPENVFSLDTPGRWMSLYVTGIVPMATEDHGKPAGEWSQLARSGRDGHTDRGLGLKTEETTCLLDEM